MANEKIERIYTVPLGKAYGYTRTKRARRSVSLLRQFLIRHMKSQDVRISEALNEFVWSGSMQHPPRKVKVKVVKEGEMVRASLPDEKPKPARKKKAPEPEKKGEQKKEEPKKEAPKAEEKAKSGEKK